MNTTAFSLYRIIEKAALLILPAVFFLPAAALGQSATASPSPVPIFSMPVEPQCTRRDIPDVLTCPTARKENVYNCIDYSRDYCTSMWEEGYQAWAIGLQADGSRCEDSGPKLLRMLTDAGCLQQVTLADGRKTTNIDGGCARRVTTGHAIVVVRTADERLKGGKAEYVAIEPQGQIAVAAWQDAYSGFYIPDYVLDSLRDIYFPALRAYGIPLNAIIGNPCGLPSENFVKMTVGGQTITFY